MDYKEVTLGIDIGGTNTKLGLVDIQGICLEFSSIPTKAWLPIENFLERIYYEIDNISNKKNKSFIIKAIGIGAPNANYYTGEIESAPNLNWGEIVKLVTIVQKKYQLPVKLTNDANAAALGEMKFGLAKEMKNFVVVTLGTGLGSGIVVNGNLVYGHSGFAGELGHTTVFLEGRKHTTKRKGSLETYVSATGIKRTVFKLLADRIEPSILRNIPFNKLNAWDISKAAEKGDFIALEAFDYTGKILGLKLSDLVALLSPEAIIFLGGLTNAGDILLNPIKKYMELYNFKVFKNTARLLISQMKEYNAAVLGAAALAWHEYESLSDQYKK